MNTRISTYTHRMKGYMALFGTGIVVRGVEVLGKFGLYFLAARALGTYDSGIFFLAMTWMALGSTIARLGMEKAMTRHIAAELAVGDIGAARRACGSGLKWTLLGGLGMAILTCVFAAPIANYVFVQPEFSVPLLLAGIAIVPQTLLVSISGALTGFSRAVSSQFLQHALWPLIMLLAIAAGARDIDSMLVVLVVSITLSTAAGGVMLVRCLSSYRPTAVGGSAEPHDPLPGLWYTARPLWLVEIIQVSLGSIPVMVLGMFADPASVGAFSVANRISMLVWVVILAMGNIIAPRFAAHYRRHEIDALRAVNRQARLAILVLGAPAIAVMLLFPGALLNIIGDGFDIATTSLFIMALGQLVNCLLPCQDIMLAMTGRGDLLRMLNILQFLTCVILAALLVPQFLMIGAAVLTAICIAQGAIGTTLAVRRILPAAL